jgi:fermentation-respiration switch protein FrsA (DUF1100 family)
VPHARANATTAARRGWRLAAQVARALVLLVAVGYLAVCAYLATQVTRAMRQPLEGTPADLGLTYESAVFPSTGDGIPLRGWYLPASGERAIVLVHGIDGTRWDAFHHQDRLAAVLVHAGYDVLTFDLRGCGESGGERLGLGWLERQDVEGAVAYVRGRGIPAGRIGLWGQSFGGAAMLLAAPDLAEVGAFVSDAAFADARPLLDGEIKARTGLPPIFTPGLSLFTQVLFGIDLSVIPPELAAPRIAPRPVLFIHGTADRRIPVEHAYRLKAAARGPADELWLVPGAGHVLSYEREPDTYAAKLVGFYDQALR